MLSWAQCRYTEIAQRIFKYSDIQYTSLTPDKILNSLMYRTLFYVNIYGSYKLLKTVRFFGPPCIYTMSQEVPTFKLPVTLSNLNRFSIFCTAEKRMKFATKTYDNTHLTLGMLLHYLGKLNIQIFCRYSANMAEMQTYCTLVASSFVVHAQILIVSVF